MSGFVVCAIAAHRQPPLPRRPSTVRARKANTMRAGSVDAMTARRADASGLSRRRRGVGLEPLGEQVEQTVDGRISPSTSPWSC